MSRTRRLAHLILAVVMLAPILSASPAQATLSGCVAGISPTSVNVGSDTGFLVGLYNPDPSPIQWVKITSPDVNNFSFENASASGWNASVGSDSVVFSEGSLDHGSDQGFSVEAVAGTTVTTQSWQVEASDAVDGADAILCSGDTSVSIANNPSQINISSLNISNIGPTSVTINWDTDIASTTQASYGLTSSYGSQTTYSPALTLTHTVTITGLSSNTGYHYQVTSTTPADGGTVSSGDNTFLTALPAPAPIIIINNPAAPAANVPGTTIKATPTETIPPAVRLTTSLSQPFKQSPLISGTADDNEAVARIEYSTDGGANWLPADRITQVFQNGRLTPAHISFQFTPPVTEDGNYALKVRATDTSSNTATTDTATLVIDRLPPQVGPLVVSSGPEVLNPDNNGVVDMLAGTDYTVTTSAVGGPTTITLSAEPVEQIKPVRQTVSLTQNPDSGLWSGLLSLKTSGIYQLVAQSLDGAGNQTSRQILTTTVTPAGRVVADAGHRAIAGAELTLYYFEPSTSAWQIWNAAPYGQTNPQITTNTGAYHLLIPQGRYYLKVHASGYHTFTTNSFQTDHPLGLASIIPLNKRAQVNIGPFTISAPDLHWQSQALPSPDQKPIATTQSLVGRQLPDFNLPIATGGSRRNLDLEGKPTVLSMLATWSPGSQEQLSALAQAQANPDVNITPVFSQERVQQVNVYLATSGVHLASLVDPDGLLVPSLQVGAVPQHIFIDRTGRIKKVMLGVLSKDQLLDQLGGL